MTTLSFFGKLLIDSRDKAHRDIPRELTWSTYDIAKAVDDGELTILNPTERVTEQWSKNQVNLAQAYANHMDATMPVVRYGWTKVSAQSPSAIEQALLVRLAREGNLDETEIDTLAVRALRCGAGDAFLELTGSWDKDKRLKLVREEITCAGSDQVSLIHACVLTRLHQVVRAMIKDGLKGNEISGSGQGLGHFISDADILSDLKAAGLDPDLADRKGRTARAYWSETKLPNAKQKELTKVWDELFSEQNNPNQAKNVLLFELERKSKSLVIQQCKEAKLKPGDLVDGRYLAEHAARSLLLVSSMTYLKTDSGAKWLIERVPNEFRQEQRWLTSLADGLSFKRAYPEDPEWDLCRANSALTQTALMDVVNAGIERLTEPENHLLGWNKVYHGVRGEGQTRKKQRELFVDDFHWRQWWMQPNEQDVPRILAAYKAPLEELLNGNSDDDIWRVAHAFFQDIHKASDEELASFLDTLPPHPTLGMGAWFTFAFSTMYSYSGSNHTNFETQFFPASFYMLYEPEQPAVVFDHLWGRGVRPNAEQTAYLIKLIGLNDYSSKDAGSALQAHQLTLQTQTTQGSSGGARRL